MENSNANTNQETIVGQHLRTSQEGDGSQISAGTGARKRNAQRYRFQRLHPAYRCCVAVTVAGLCPPDQDLRGGLSGTTEVFKEETQREVRDAHVVCDYEGKLGSGTGQGVGSGC